MKQYGIWLLTPLLLSGCDNTGPANVIPASGPDTRAELQQMLRQVKHNLVFVAGGEFLMGDFGREYGPEKIRLDVKKDSKPLHRVTLSSYSIAKFKTTNQEYQLYLKLNNLQLKKANNSLAQEYRDSLNKLPDTPAHMDWSDAEQYCAWLSKVSGLPFALPTEAQWEYAARSRGGFVIVGTHSGELEMHTINRGINIAGDLDREDFARKMGLKGGIMVAMPVDSYPPTPLGLYDMAGNGLEWMQDWYDPAYYQHSPAVDPRGPDKPVFKDYEGHDTKVLRGASLSGAFNGLTVARFNENPATRIIDDKTVRCVVNHPQAVK